MEKTLEVFRLRMQRLIEAAERFVRANNVPLEGTLDHTFEQEYGDLADEFMPVPSSQGALFDNLWLDA